MITNNVEPSVFYDQVVKKLDGVGAFVAQLISLLIMASDKSEPVNIFRVLLIFSIATILGKAVGTIIGMRILTKDKKN